MQLKYYQKLDFEISPNIKLKALIIKTISSNFNIN